MGFVEYVVAVCAAAGLIGGAATWMRSNVHADVIERLDKTIIRNEQSRDSKCSEHRAGLETLRELIYDIQGSVKRIEGILEQRSKQ